MNNLTCLKTEDDALLTIEQSTDTSNDLILAQYLQYEYDRAYDTQLRREEQHVNGNSKGSYHPLVKDL